MAKELDALVESVRTQPSTRAPYRVRSADALVDDEREGGRVLGVHVLIATGVAAEGHGEILGAQGIHRGSGRLTRLLSRPRCLRAFRPAPRCLRCRPRLDRRDQGESSFGLLAALSDPLSAGSAH
jgi:hypothetical protein